MSDVTRLVDELTTLLFEVLKRWEVEGRVCEIVACGACRKKADRPSSVVHESDCPVHRLWQAMEVAEVVVRANAEEICDLEDARDALEAKVNALTAEMECRNQLTSRIASLEAENARLRGAGVGLADALVMHRRDMHQTSNRPCPTCRESKAALDAWSAALAASAGEVSDGESV